MREARDTLIFTTVNYTLYSFWVEYEDGSSDVIECAPISPGESKRKQREQKLLFDKLMDIANQSKDSTSAAPETDTAMLDTLQKSTIFMNPEPYQMMSLRKSVLRF